MAKKKPTRIFRKSTPEERRRLADLQDALDKELPQIKLRGRMVRQELKKAAETIASLRSARELRGLSLADIQSRTNIQRSALCKLETSPEPNPTMRTLYRYAEALDLELDISLRPKPQK